VISEGETCPERKGREGAAVILLGGRFLGLGLWGGGGIDLRDCSRATILLCLFWPVRVNLFSLEYSSIFTAPSCPLSAAYQGGVRPNLSGLSGLTSSRPSSICTTPACPRSVAHQSGVQRPLSGLSGLTPSRLSSIFTTSSCPCLAACQSGVRP